MIKTEALSRLRDLLNEASAGFYTDAQLYQYLDSGMNMTIQLYMAKIEVARFTDKFARSVALEPLSTLYGTHALTISTDEYVLPTDYLLWDYVEYSSAQTRPLTPTPYVNFSQGAFEFINTYTTFSNNNPAFSIRGANIRFFPVPSANDSSGFNLYYYKKPTDIPTLSGSAELPIKVETHEGIVYIAFSMALSQNNQYSESEIYFKKGMELLDKLT